MLLEHLQDLYAFYGTETGVKVARKHISWYTRGLRGSAAFRHRMNQLEECAQQMAAVRDFFVALEQEDERLQYAPELEEAA